MSHRPWFKVAINTVLRFLQTRRRPASMFVMVSYFDGPSDDATARCVGYGFRRILHQEVTL